MRAIATEALRVILLAQLAAGCSISAVTDVAKRPIDAIRTSRTQTTQPMSLGAIDAQIANLEPILLGGPDGLAKGAPPLAYDAFARKARSGKYVPPDLEAARYEALRTAATAYAAQAGYYRRCYEIMQVLERHSAQLSDVFNFNRVAYGTKNEAGHLLPPIVSRATSTVQVNATMTEIVAADEYYRIEVPGRLVPVLPTWRDYLVLALEEPNDPEPAFLPRGKEEEQVYAEYLAEGWMAGVHQAEEALQASMHLLRRDYLGMIEYRRAAQAGLIDELVVDLSSARSAGELNELYVGERRVRIVDSATFQRDPARWTPLRRRL